MYTRNAILLATAAFISLPMASAQAGSLETQNNAVANGAIFIAPLDPDRSDWASVPTYQPDGVDVDPPSAAPVLSHGEISVAHDDDNFYFRLLVDNYITDELDPDWLQQSFFGAHHQILIDTDQDRSTGWIGGDGDPLTDDSFFAIGADIMIEGPAVWKFGTFAGGGNRELWDWGNLVAWGGVNFDDSPPSDIELQVDRSTIFFSNPTGTAFDFIPLTTDVAFTTSDVYPNAGIFDPTLVSEGDYFTYDMNYVAPPELEGDLDLDGFVGITDLNIVLSNWNLAIPPGDAAADPSGDNFVGIEDLNIVLGNWNAGTPPPNAVPEPATLALLSIGAMALLKRRA